MSVDGVGVEETYYHELVREFLYINLFALSCCYAFLYGKRRDHGGLEPRRESKRKRERERERELMRVEEM